MKQNDLVTFKNPIAEDYDKNGKLATFRVVEMRGPRVLVADTEMLKGLKVYPTCVYLEKDLVVIE